MDGMGVHTLSEYMECAVWLIAACFLGCCVHPSCSLCVVVVTVDGIAKLAWGGEHCTFFIANGRGRRRGGGTSGLFQGGLGGGGVRLGEEKACKTRVGGRGVNQASTQGSEFRCSSDITS